LLGAAVEIEPFEIIVKAMLRWSDEPKAPKKTLGRTSMPAGPRDELDDEEDEAIVDDDEDEDDAEDDDEPVQPLHAAPAGGKAFDADPDEAEASEQLD
jgi:hypothetical protein